MSPKKIHRIFCIICNAQTEWFVAVLKENSSASYEKHWYICRRCYEEDQWQTVIKTKEPTTKSGLSTGSKSSLGGEYSGDLKLELNGYELVGEVKYRDKSTFPSPFKVLEGRDIAFYKRRTGKPQTLVIIEGDTFLKLMENSNEKDKEPS
jgi:hypothetical protein